MSNNALEKYIKRPFKPKEEKTLNMESPLEGPRVGEEVVIFIISSKNYVLDSFNSDFLRVNEHGTGQSYTNKRVFCSC